MIADLQSTTNDQVLPAHFTETVVASTDRIQPWKARLSAEYQKASEGCSDKPWVNWEPSKEAPLRKPWMSWRGVNKADGTAHTTQLVT